MAESRATSHVPLGPGREFDLVRALLGRWGDLAHGIGDDAAALDIPAGERLVASVDTSVEGVHFRHEWLSSGDIAYRAAAAALSDLAAMAARPIGMLIALVLPDSALREIEALADGIGEAARASGAPIVGGDIARGTSLAISCTVFGTTRTPTRRDAVSPGDRLYVTGLLGGPAAALRGLQSGSAIDDAWRERFARPRPRLAEARWLAQHGVRAMIDISDGLASELRHLSVASGVELRVDVDRVPVLRGCSMREATAGGEEYELVLSSPHVLDVDAFARTFALPLSEIGVARAAEAPDVVTMRDGRPVRLDLGAGYDHFAG